MTYCEIARGEQIELDVLYNGKSINFKSEIVRIFNNSILITSINYHNRVISFTDQCTFNLLYLSEGKLYIWEKVTVKLVKSENALFHKIDLNGEGKPFNRREAFRMYIGEEMPLIINMFDGPAAIPVLIKDISESGLAFITKDDFDTKRTFRLKIDHNNSMINMMGVIIRKEFMEHLDSTLYGCKLLEKDQMLSKYIAEKQGEQLRKKSKIYQSAPLKNVIL